MLKLFMDEKVDLSDLYMQELCIDYLEGMVAKQLIDLGDLTDDYYVQIFYVVGPKDYAFRMQLISYTNEEIILDECYTFKGSYNTQEVLSSLYEAVLRTFCQNAV